MSDLQSPKPSSYLVEANTYETLLEERTRLRAEVDRLTRERDEHLTARRVLNIDGARLQDRAEAAERKAEEARAECRELRVERHVAQNLQALAERKLAMAVEIMKILPAAKRLNADGEYAGWKISGSASEPSVNYACHRITSFLAELENPDGIE